MWHFGLNRDLPRIQLDQRILTLLWTCFLSVIQLALQISIYWTFGDATRIWDRAWCISWFWSHTTRRNAPDTEVGRIFEKLKAENRVLSIVESHLKFDFLGCMFVAKCTWRYGYIIDPLPNEKVAIITKILLISLATVIMKPKPKDAEVIVDRPRNSNLWKWLSSPTGQWNNRSDVLKTVSEEEWRDEVMAAYAVKRSVTSSDIF
jgi:hypothetical protein